MIKPQCFNECFEALKGRYGRSFDSKLVAATYYSFLSPRFDDAQFEQAVMLWLTEEEKFPSPRELYDIWSGTQPAPSPAPTAKGKLYSEMTDEERKMSDAGRAKIRHLLGVKQAGHVSSKAGFASIGDSIGNVLGGRHAS